MQSYEKANNQTKLAFWAVVEFCAKRGFPVQDYKGRPWSDWQKAIKKFMVDHEITAQIEKKGTPSRVIKALNNGLSKMGIRTQLGYVQIDSLSTGKTIKVAGMSAKEKACGDGLWSSKCRRNGDGEQVVIKNNYPEKCTYLSSLSPATVTRFKALYSQYKDQVEYRIRFGSALERAQSTIIKKRSPSNGLISGEKR
jgi:hypothetical protein